MIRAKSLAKLLQQGVTGGVTATLLFDAQGSLLGFAGEDFNSNQMVAAVVANMWTQMESKDPAMETMLLEFDKGRIAAVKTSDFVLCLYGAQVPVGMLKLKATALAEYLEGPLNTVINTK